MALSNPSGQASRWLGRTLAEQRQTALLSIHEQSQRFEAMVQRAAASGETPEKALLEKVRQRFSEIEQAAARFDVGSMQLGVLDEDARCQGQLEAYACPQRDIAVEARFCFDRLTECGMPPSVLEGLRGLLAPKLEAAAGDLPAARGALRALLAEQQRWEAGLQEYEHAMHRHASTLLGVAIAAALLAIAGLHLAPAAGMAFPAGILAAGVAGSTLSIVTRLPGLDMGLSGRPHLYARRILTRMSAGSLASLAGYALLVSGLPAVKGLPFGDVVTACTAGMPGSCGTPGLLLVLGTSLLFGVFSERVLLWLTRGVSSLAAGRKKASNTLAAGEWPESPAPSAITADAAPETAPDTAKAPRKRSRTRAAPAPTAADAPPADQAQPEAAGGTG